MKKKNNKRGKKFKFNKKFLPSLANLFLFPPFISIGKNLKTCRKNMCEKNRKERRKEREHEEK